MNSDSVTTVRTNNHSQYLSTITNFTKRVYIDLTIINLDLNILK